MQGYSCPNPNPALHHGAISHLSLLYSRECASEATGDGTTTLQEPRCCSLAAFNWAYKIYCGPDPIFSVWPRCCATLCFFLLQLNTSSAGATKSHEHKDLTEKRGGVPLTCVFILHIPRRQDRCMHVQGWTPLSSAQDSDMPGQVKETQELSVSTLIYPFPKRSQRHAICAPSRSMAATPCMKLEARTRVQEGGGREWKSPSPSLGFPSPVTCPSLFVCVLFRCNDVCCVLHGSMHKQRPK